MDFPTGATIECAGSSPQQFQCIARFWEEVMGFADNHTANAHTAGEYPLFGTGFRGVRMLLKHPVEERASVVF